MPAPTVSIPVTGIDPKIAATENVKTQINTALSTLYDDTQTRAPSESPAFTGTPTGITKAHVGLGNADNTADADKPVSTPQQTALDAKAPLASPAFTGTPTGITKAHVGLGNVDNTADADKPVSTAQRAAITTVQARRTLLPIDGVAGGVLDAAGYVVEGRTVFSNSIGLSGSGAAQDITPETGRHVEAVVASQFSAMGRTQVFRQEDMPDNGSLIIDEQSYRPLTGGPAPASFVGEVAAGRVRVKRAGREDEVRFRTSGLIGGTDTVYLCLVLGQSLALAHKDSTPKAKLFNASPILPLMDNVMGAGMFDASAVDGQMRGPRPLQVEPSSANKNVAIAAGQLARVVSLQEWTHAGDQTYFGTISSPLAFALQSGHCALGTISLHAHVGTGATPIADFEKGSSTGAHFANAMAVVQAAQDYVDDHAEGRSLEVLVIWNQGEQDNADGTGVAAYKTALGGVVTDLTTDIAAITGQAALPFLVQQTSQLTSSALGMAGQAQADLMIDGTLGMIPTYPMKPGSSGSTHMLPLTYLPWGAATAYGLAELIDDGTWKSPYVVAGGVAKSGSAASYPFAGGSGGYGFDTDTIPNAPDGWYGHTARDNTGDLTVTAMAWNGTTLDVTYDRAISGTLTWKFGIDHYASGAALMPAPPAPRVNIRDDSGWTCPMTGQVISGWAIQQQGEN